MLIVCNASSAASGRQAGSKEAGTDGRWPCDLALLQLSVKRALRSLLSAALRLKPFLRISPGLRERFLCESGRS